MYYILYYILNLSGLCIIIVYYTIYSIGAHTLSSVLISFRVQNAFSIDKGRVFLEEEKKTTLTWWSLTFHLSLTVLVLPDKIISWHKDLPSLLSAGTFYVSLGEMTNLSFLHQPTTISTSGLCHQIVKATRFQSNNRSSFCVVRQSQSSPSDLTPPMMSLLLLVERRSTNCGPPQTHSDAQFLVFVSSIGFDFSSQQSLIP